MTGPALQVLGDVADKVTVGHVGSTSKYYRDEGVMFLRTQNVGSGELDLTDVRYVTPDFAARLGKSRVEAGDVLLSRVITDTVRVAVVPSGLGEVNCANIVLVRPGATIDASYLARFIASPIAQRQLLRGKVGSAQTVVNTKVVRNWRLPLPPLTDQKRIAGILDAADALRAKRRESLAQLDTLLQSTFLDMFGDPVTNPMGWERIPFGELITHGPQNGIYKAAKLYGSGTRILRIDGFYEGRVTDVAGLKRVALSDSEVLKYGLKESDVVINRVNSRSHLGKCALIPALEEPVVFESNMMRIRLDRSRVLPRFATEFLQTQYVKIQILRACKDAVNQSSINQGDVNAFHVLVPPVSDQETFVRAVNAIELQKARQRAHLAELDTLFASLQSRAFRGGL